MKYLPCFVSSKLVIIAYEIMWRSSCGKYPSESFVHNGQMFCHLSPLPTLTFLIQFIRRENVAVMFGTLISMILETFLDDV